MEASERTAHAPRRFAADARRDRPVIVIDRDCSSCGTGVHVEVEEPPLEAYARLLRDQAEGRTPIRCQRCEDEDEAKREAEERAVELAARRERARDRAGIPPAFRALTFDDLECDDARTEAIAAAREWGEGTSAIPGVYLWGDVGRGKTWIMAAAAEAMIQRAVPVRWVDVATLLTQLRMPFSSSEYAKATRALRPARPGEALCLDDLDKALTHDRDVQPLYVAVNGWVNAGAPLFVNANRHLDAVAEAFGATFGIPIASRLVGHCLDVEVKGRDRRVEP